MSTYNVYLKWGKAWLWIGTVKAHTTITAQRAAINAFGVRGKRGDSEEHGNIYQDDKFKVTKCAIGM